jgi:hypothetical protein
LVFWRVCDASPVLSVSVSAGIFLFLEAFLGIVPVVVVYRKGIYSDLMGMAGGPAGQGVIMRAECDGTGNVLYK